MTLALIPALLSPVAMADGASDFATFCSACHGAEGAGDGAAAVALDPKPSNFADPAFWTEERTDEHLTKAIKEGGAAVGKSPLMAPWGGALSDEQITAVVEHLKTLKKEG